MSSSFRKLCCGITPLYDLSFTMIGLFNPFSTASINFFLSPFTHSDIAIADLEGAQVSDREWSVFAFDALRDSRGKRFYFYLKYPPTLVRRLFQWLAKGGVGCAAPHVKSFL